MVHKTVNTQYFCKLSFVKIPKSILLLAISFLLFSHPGQVKAQTAIDLVAKGEPIEQTLRLLNTGASITNPEFEVVLPANVSLHPGSIDLMNTNLSGRQYSLTRGTATGFVITLKGVFNNGEIAHITFKRLAGCIDGVVTGIKDNVFVVSSPGVSAQSDVYTIWEPIVYLTGGATVPVATTAIAGQDVTFSFGLRNSGLNAFVYNFYITIDHTGFNAPTNIVLEKDANTLNVDAGSITTVDANSVKFKVTSAMLSTLGFTKGRIEHSTDKTLGLTFKAAPKITSCGTFTTVKVATQIDGCDKVTTEPLHNVSLTVIPPGAVLSSLTAKRINFDFPDAANSRTVNGAWRWVGGSADPLADQVRNGDTLELRLKGKVYTSSLLPQIGIIYTDIYAKNASNANTYNEFAWNQLVTVRAEDSSGTWVESNIMADVMDNNGYLRYKIAIADNVGLQSGGEVELIITAVMKNTAIDNTPCKISADMYATESQGLPENGYPTSACRSKSSDVTVKRVVVSDTLTVETLAFTASCAVEQSSIKFTSSELSTPSVVGDNYFTEEFRSNHYIKELQVFVPAEASLEGGQLTFDSEMAPISLTIPAYEIISFTANATKYENAKRYIFDLSALYGVYGNSSSKFKDEILHQLLFDFDVKYEGVVGGSGQASSILYVATPINPSAPDAILAPMSVVQNVSLKTVSPILTVSDANVDVVNKKAIWTFTLNNPDTAADIEKASLKIENISGGTFSNLTATLNGTPVTVLGGIAQLGNIAHNTISTIVIEAEVDQACRGSEAVVATLRYEPCSAPPKAITSMRLSFETPKSTILIATTPAFTELKMCEDFTVKIEVTATEGVVYDPKAVLEFPKNSSGGIGVTFLGITEINGVDHTATMSGYYEGPGVSDNLSNVEFELGDITGAILGGLLEAGTPNNSVELVVRLQPNCAFPVNARLTSYVYGRNFCNEYNSRNSGMPFPTDILTIDGLESAYDADVKFSKTKLTFDKVLNDETTILSVKKAITGGGGAVGTNDVIVLTMPATLKLETNPTGVISDVIQGTGISAVRVVTWPVPTTLSTSDWTEYSLKFVMENPAAYTDLLSGSITAVVVSRVAGLSCGLTSCSDTETNAGESLIAFEIIDLFPAIAKDVSYKASSLLNYSFTYTFTLKNFGSLPINNIRLEDDLSNFHSKGSVRNINIVPSSPSLIKNTSYNGSTNILLLTSDSKLLPNETQTVTLTFDILFNEDWKNKIFTIGNTAVFIGSNDNGTDYDDTSNHGTDPDLTDNTPTVTDPINTNPPEVIVVPIVNIPPPGFGVTADGVECFEGDEGALTPLDFDFVLKDGVPLDYDLCFTVYTKDSIATIADNDYQRVLAKVICIKAGDLSANEIVTVTIVGDNKYEKDEPLILDVKAGADAMTCNPPIITILNDDAIPTIVIDDITQPTKDTTVVNIGDLYQLEGTSDTQRTVFRYCVKLNAVAPQDLVLKVVFGNENDTAIKGRDYYPGADEIAKNIPAGTDEVCFDIQVDPDDIPENNEYFTMSFSLEAGGVEFYQEVRKAYIIDDDELKVGIMGEALVYCPKDDLQRRSEKLAAYINVPAGYELKWYTSPTTAIEVPEPLMENALSGDEATYYLGYYNPDENYESPVGKRAIVKIAIQSAPLVTITSTPASPLTLFSGQTVLFTATAGLASYDFILNGTSLTSGATSQNEVVVHRDKFMYTNINTYTPNVVDVIVVDSEGCSWDESITFEAKQIELPNAFIPEGNNPDNQIFLKGYDIKVFNRWGHLLYEGTEGWDGRYKGSYVASGTYFYVVYITQENGAVVEEKGFVMVVGAAKK